MVDLCSVDHAILLLQASQVVGLPTETVYGLAGDGTSQSAVDLIFSLKGRPRTNPLIVHCANFEFAQRYGVFSDAACELARRFWPGPLTLVVPYRAGSGIVDDARAGLDTVALRVPSHPIMREVLEAVGFGVVAPSANRSGRPSPTQFAHVAQEFGDALAFCVDGGRCEAGVESSVVKVVEDDVRLLRAGPLDVVVLEACLGIRILPVTKASVAESPGQLFRHYAPEAPLKLNQIAGIKDAVFIGFGSVPQGISDVCLVLNLSEGGDLKEAAHNLFALLRAADSFQPKAILVAPIPEVGIGVAINDRLRRGAL